MNNAVNFGMDLGPSNLMTNGGGKGKSYNRQYQRYHVTKPQQKTAQHRGGQEGNMVDMSQSSQEHNNTLMNAMKTLQSMGLNGNNSNHLSAPVEGGKKVRKLTEYNKFVKKHFADIKKNNPNKTAPVIMQEIGKLWKKTKK